LSKVFQQYAQYTLTDSTVFTQSFHIPTYFRGPPLPPGLIGSGKN